MLSGIIMVSALCLILGACESTGFQGVHGQWHTYLGSASPDYGERIALDSLGNIYVAGYSVGGFSQAESGWGSPISPFTFVSAGTVNAFVAKLDAGGRLVWNTFLGYSGVSDPDLYGIDIVLDGAGNIFVASFCDGDWGDPIQPSPGQGDCLVAKLSNDGQLLWHTFLGSRDLHTGRGIALNGAGNILVTGASYQSWGSPINPFSGDVCAYAAKLNDEGQLIWNTFLDQLTVSHGIAVDKNDNIYLTGIYWHGIGGAADAFVTKLSPDGTQAWQSFLGGDGSDYGRAIRSDGLGHLFVSGTSGDSWGPGADTYSGGWDAFVAKLDEDGNLEWNSFLGSSNADDGYDVAPSGGNRILTTGSSYSGWGPGARHFRGAEDAFAAEVDNDGDLIWDEFVGCAGIESGRGIAVGADASVFIIGYADTSWGHAVRPHSGTYDAFVTRIKE